MNKLDLIFNYIQEDIDSCVINEKWVTKIESDSICSKISEVSKMDKN